ncbi:MAG: CHAD domain-containing protein [Hyphomicrobium sp.]|nr:CHAD domain-containing protein [Hyphomicrobium sp.]
MAYRLNPGRVKAKAIRRIAREQVTRAVTALSQNPVPPAGVHEARKCVKRLRSLLRLMEPSLRAKDFRARNKALGRLGDQLAGAREAHVMRETVAKLESHFGTDAQATLAPLKGMFGGDVEGHAPELAGERAKHIIEAFAKEGRRLDKIDIKGSGIACVLAGLEKTYRTARKAFAQAYDKPDDDRFHELRKAVQWHQRHMVLLSRAWPEYFSVRIAACRELAEDLGDDHDLSVLIDMVERRGGETVDQAAVAELARNRQAELRAAAFALTQRLFAERPAAFTWRMERYWAAPPLLPATSSRPGAKAAHANPEHVEPGPVERLQAKGARSAPRLAINARKEDGSQTPP